MATSKEPLRDEDRLFIRQALDKLFPRDLPGEDLDLDAKVKDRHVWLKDAGDAHGVFLCGNDRIDFAPSAPSDEAFDFTGRIAVMIGVGF